MEQRRTFPNAFNKERPPSRQGGDNRRWQRPERPSVAQGPPQPKPLNLQSATEFPSLGNRIVNTRDTVQGTSLAEKLRQTIAEEEERTNRLRYEKNAKKEDNYVFALPVSSLMAKRRAAEQAAQDQRRREVEQDDENYRYQMTGVAQHDEEMYSSFAADDEPDEDEKEVDASEDALPPTHEQ